MGGETMTDSWLSIFWRPSRKSSASEPEKEKALVGILAFEVASIMSKVVNLWHCLSDRNIVRLKEEILNSFGIQKLVSEDDEYLMDLVLAEILDNVGRLLKSVATLGKKCVDPAYHVIECILDDPDQIEVNWLGWEYRLKKMERKVKKMERFVAAAAQLFQELEVLAELEQSLRRMKAGADLGQMKLFEFQQKVVWQRQEVRNLREMSPWVRTYDYTVRLLLRSIFTIIERIKHVFGLNRMGTVLESNYTEHVGDKCLVRSHSISALIQASVHPSEDNRSRFYSGSLGRSFSNLGLSNEKNRSSSKKLHARTPSVICGRHAQLKNRRFAHAGPFKGCMNGGSESPVVNSCMPSGSGPLMSYCTSENNTSATKDCSALPTPCSGMIGTKVSLFDSKSKLLSAHPSTLGYAALALHYANIIILIEKLAMSPHLISHDARDDLYDMLTSNVRNCLRAKLRVFSKSLASSVYDAALAAEWASALERILDWLSPLAHNMIMWHSDRNFEKQRMIPGAKVLLVQTLFFANQAKTEAAITELLMGLNYLSRFAGELNGKPFLQSTCSRSFDDYSFYRESMCHNMIHNSS